MRRFLPLGGLVGILIASGCGGAVEEPSNESREPKVGTAKAGVASVMGGAEVSLDAPWRLEPIGDDIGAQSSIYPPIPIVVSVHDASMQVDPETNIPFGQFCGIQVHEYWNDDGFHEDPFNQGQWWQLDTDIPASSPNVREIERSNNWTYTSDKAGRHEICQRWATPSATCAAQLDVGSSAEWHATVLYTPQQMAVGGTIAKNQSSIRNGDDVVLRITAKFAKAGGTCNGGLFQFSNKVSVHLGNAGLPRFDDGWMYGDLHYHSQGTDNEGESGYSHRTTMQTMRAMGLDFAFATEHASDSGQVTDMDAIFIDNLPDVPWPFESLLEWAVDKVNKKSKDYQVRTDTNARRDMSQTRFDELRDWLNRPNTGANTQVMRVSSGGRRVPRMFLGGEVDVVPEISEAEKQSGWLTYGNGLGYHWAGACTAVPDVFNTIGNYTTLDTCPYGPIGSLTSEVSEGGRYMVKDIQGLIESAFYARQHLVWLPSDGTRNDAFVSSHTTTYGGASQRLKDLLNPNNTGNTMAGKGYAFLAHPVNAASGNTVGRLGPDIIPYSDVQLKTAFDSPVILGLQLWNEDVRLVSPKNGFPFADTDPAGPAEKKWGRWEGKNPRAYFELHHGLSAWEKMLQWGLRPSQTANIPWLAPGAPRRVFMAGGSDAHGDVNYRREGYMHSTEAVVDTALGKPRNLVDVGLSRPESVIASDGSTVGAISQGQVTSALANGVFSVTDGPAVRIAIDTNNNNVIDAGDVPMGGIANLGTGMVPLIVEWKSTPEFQAVSRLDVYVGAASSVQDKTLVYAPVDHGIHNADTPSGALSSTVYKDPSGGEHRKLQDGYAADRTGVLKIIPTTSDYVVGGSPYWGRRKIWIRASDYPIGTYKTTTTPGTQTCRPNHWCNKPGHEDQCEVVCYGQPGTTTHSFQSPVTPNRLYVRAFARTQTLSDTYCTGTSAAALTAQRTGKCIERLAFTNPIWMR